MEKLKSWLDQPDNPGSYYELLGYPCFFDDRETLLAAVRAATKFLHQYQNHKTESVVRRARGFQLQCATAGHTFSDDIKWQAYNTELMNRLRDEYLAHARQSDVRQWLRDVRPVAPGRIDEVARFISMSAETRPVSAIAATSPQRACDPDPVEIQTDLYRPQSRGMNVPTSTAAAQSQLPPNPPFMVENYEVLERLGSGGIGIVYKARHVNLQKLVAVKLLRYDKSIDAGAVTRFHREMLAFGRLDHPNIVRATDAGQFQGLQFLVMDLIDGRNLHDLVQLCGPLPVAETCHIIRQAALGLQHAHEQGLVHRDVKPSNLMVTPDGTVKILDLGLAMVAPSAVRLECGDNDPNAELTAVGVIVGTVDFMAPEQLGGREHVEPRSDVYSLGCTMFYLLTGQSPFRDCGSNVFQRTAAHISHPVPSLSPFRSDVPHEVETILRRMLAKAPQERFSAAELAVALSAAMRVSTGTDAVVSTVQPTIEIAVAETGIRQPPPLPRQPASQPGSAAVAIQALTAPAVTTLLPIPPPPTPPKSKPPSLPKKQQAHIAIPAVVPPPRPAGVSGHRPPPAIVNVGDRHWTPIPVRLPPRRKSSNVVLWVSVALFALAILGIIVLLSLHLGANSSKPSPRKASPKRVTWIEIEEPAVAEVWQEAMTVIASC